MTIPGATQPRADGVRWVRAAVLMIGILAGLAFVVFLLRPAFLTARLKAIETVGPPRQRDDGPRAAVEETERVEGRVQTASSEEPPALEPPTGEPGGSSVPVVPDHFLFRPFIATTSGTVRGGTVFAVALPGEGRPILLTALHVFGRAGGLKAQLKAADVPRAVRAVVLSGLFDDSEPIEVGKDVLPIPDAGPLGEPSEAGDIVAIRAPAGVELTTRPLATVLPKPGERVWLAASLLAGPPDARRLHAAKVEGLDDDGLLLYLFDEPRIPLRATSGAPVLNAAGEVVAIQLGSVRHEQGVMGVGNPVTRFRRYLQAAVAAKPAADRPPQ